MPLLVTHTTAADGTFSTAGAAAWNANHTISGTIDLATETTGTINLLTQTSGATANQLMYGGASGQVAQSSGMTWTAASSLLTVRTSLQIGAASGSPTLSITTSGISRINAVTSLLIAGYTASVGSTSNGGQLQLQGGNARTTGSGGRVELRAGSALNGNFNGGNIEATAGNSATGTDPNGNPFNTNGGNCIFSGGNSGGNTGSTAGSVRFFAGSTDSNLSPGPNTGNIEFYGGGCTGIGGIPGSIAFLVGSFFPGDVSNPIGTISFGASNGVNEVAVAPNGSLSHTKDFPVTVDGNNYYIRLYS